MTSKEHHIPSLVTGIIWNKIVPLKSLPSHGSCFHWGYLICYGDAGNMKQLIIYSWSMTFSGVYGQLFWSGWEFLVCFHLTLACLPFSLIVYIFLGKIFTNIFELFGPLVLVLFGRRVTYGFSKISSHPLHKFCVGWNLILGGDWRRISLIYFWFSCLMDESINLFRILHFVIPLFGLLCFMFAILLRLCIEPFLGTPYAKTSLLSHAKVDIIDMPI